MELLGQMAQTPKKKNENDLSVNSVQGRNATLN